MSAFIQTWAGIHSRWPQIRLPAAIEYCERLRYHWCAIGSEFVIVRELEQFQDQACDDVRIWALLRHLPQLSCCSAGKAAIAMRSMNCFRSSMTSFGDWPVDICTGNGRSIPYRARRWCMKRICG